MQRAAQHEEFTEAVRAQTARQRATAAQSASRMRMQEEDRRSRMALTHRRSTIGRMLAVQQHHQQEALQKKERQR